MRTTILLAVTMLATTPALADKAGTEEPRIVRGETIVIEGHAPPPAVLPKPVKRYTRIAPRYSDYAIEHDVWTRAWVLLDIDERGTVSRVKLLKHPGADLESYAIDRALGMKFDPALDGTGHVMRTQLITSIEWPSYWWMVAREGVATRIPEAIENVPCRGSGPVHVDSIHPGYRDCSAPDLTRATAEPWITR